MRFSVPAAAKSPVPLVLIWTLRILAVIAFGCGIFLSWQSLQSGPVPGCGGGSAWDCDHVLTSTWSRWLEIPVSYLGTLTYAGILVALMLLGPKVSSRWQTIGWSLLVPLVVMAAVSAVWFTGIQFFTIGKFCFYCLITHSCGFMILVLMCIWINQYQCLNISPRDSRLGKWGLGKWLGLWLTGGLLGGAMLILGQIVFPHDTFVVEEYDSTEVEAPQGNEAEDNLVFDAPGAGDTADANVTFAAPSEFNAPTEFNAPSEFVAPSEPEAGSDDELTDTSSEQSSDYFADDLLEPTRLATNHAATGVHTTQKPIPANRKHRFYRLADEINVYEFPVLGDVEAPNLIVELVDYTCPQCRDMYHNVEAARQYFGDQMAVVVRPIALERSCNPYVTQDHPKHKNACIYVRLALAVWHSEPTKFEEFHAWLMGPETIPNVEEASAFAAELIGEEQLKASVRSVDVIGMLGNNHQLWKRTGGTLPFLFAGGRLIRGVPRNDQHFIDTLTKQLPLEPVSTP